MIGRIVHTSVQIGLGTGVGFQPVVQTKSLPQSVVEHAVRETGYAHPFAPGDKRNPTLFLHRTAVLGGRSWHFLIRINDAVSDYSGRSNRLSQCVVVDDAGLSLLKSGPCEVLLGFPWEASWPSGRKPFVEEECPQPQSVALPSGVCKAWQLATGDAGWAGELALSVGKKQKAVIVAGPEHDTLALFAEALALLPAAVRWQVTFTTCQLDPSDVTWRAVRSDIKHQAPDPNTEIVIDLAAIKAGGQMSPGSGLAARARGNPGPDIQGTEVLLEPDSRASVRAVDGGAGVNTGAFVKQRLSQTLKQPQQSFGRRLNQEKPPSDLKSDPRVGGRKGAALPVPPGPAPSGARGLSSWASILLGVALVLFLVLFVLRELYAPGGFLQQAVVPSQPRKRIDTGNSAAYDKRRGTEAEANSGSAEKSDDKKNQELSKGDGLTDSGNASDESPAKNTDMPQPTSGSPEQSAVAAESPLEPTSPGSAAEQRPDKRQQEARRKAKEQKEWRDAFSRSARELPLPKNLNGGKQSLGIPWSWAIDLTKAELLIQPLKGDPTKLVVGLPEKTDSGSKWTIFEQRTNPTSGAEKSFPVATVSSKDDQLVWEWRPNTKPATAITILFSTISFPQLLPEAEFCFRKGRASPYTKTFVVSDLPDVGEGRGDSGQVRLPDDIFGDAFGGSESYYPTLSLLKEWCERTKALRLAVRLRCQTDSSDWQCDPRCRDISKGTESKQGILSAKITDKIADPISLENSDGLSLRIDLRANGTEGWRFEKRFDPKWPIRYQQFFYSQNAEKDKLLEKIITEEKLRKYGPQPPDRVLSQTRGKPRRDKALMILKWCIQNEVHKYQRYRELWKQMRLWQVDDSKTSHGRGDTRFGTLMKETDYAAKWFPDDQGAGFWLVFNELKEIRDSYEKVNDGLARRKTRLDRCRDKHQELLRTTVTVNVSLGLMKSQSEQDDKFDVPLVGLE